MSARSRGNATFNVKLIIGGKKKENARKNWSGSPTSEVIHIYSEEVDDEGQQKSYYFSANDLLESDPNTRVFSFRMKLAKY